MRNTRRILVFLIAVMGYCIPGIAAYAQQAQQDQEIELMVRPTSTGEIATRFAQIEEVLAGARVGEAARLRAVSPELLRMPFGINDAQDPELFRRWNHVLAVSIAALRPAQRADFLHILDEDMKGDSSHGLSLDAAAQNGLCLPAPLAQASLRLAAAVAFDHGRFRDSLAIDALLRGMTPASADIQRRDDQALMFSGLGSQVDPNLLLPEPGLPVEATVAQSPNVGDVARIAAGLTVAWTRGPSALMGRDPWDHILWERRIPIGAEILCGAGGALIQDHGRMQVIREDGTQVAYLPALGYAISYPIAAGSAWFVIGSTVQRIDLATAAVSSVQLPQEPLVAPLVRGPSSWWLTRDLLVRCTADQVDARIELGVVANSGWRWGVDATGIFLRTPEGKSWRIPAYNEELAQADLLQRAHLLNHALRFEQTLALAKAHPQLMAEPAGAHEVMLAHLAQSTEQSAAWMQSLARTSSDQMLMQYGRLLDANSSGEDTGPLTSSLRELAHSNPQVVIPRERGLLAHDPATWVHRLSGAALVGWLDHTRAEWPQACDQRQPVQIHTHTDVHSPSAPDDLVLGNEPQTTAITCYRAGTTSVLWQNRWSTAAVQSATQHSHLVRDGYLLVSEGASRLEIIDMLLGDRLGTIDFVSADAEPAQITVLGSDDRHIMHVAMSTPLGINTSVVLASSDGKEMTVDLPGAARWLVRAPLHNVLVCLSDGDALLIDGMGIVHRGVALPPVMMKGPRPLAGPVGLVCDGQLFDWR